MQLTGIVNMISVRKRHKNRSPEKFFFGDPMIFMDGREENQPPLRGQICTGGLSTRDSISQYPSIYKGKKKLSWKNLRKHSKNTQK